MLFGILLFWYLYAMIMKHRCTATTRSNVKLINECVNKAKCLPIKLLHYFHTSFWNLILMMWEKIVKVD